MRLDRLLGEPGIGADTAAGRTEFERRMEARRQAETDEAEWAPVRRGWCLGREAFRKGMLVQMGTRKSTAMKLHRWRKESVETNHGQAKAMV